MKKEYMISMLFLFCVLCPLSLVAQERFRLTEHVTIVNYGSTFWLEDDKNQMSISISIAQEGIDRRNNQKMYKVVCGDFTKTVVKTAVSTAVREGIRHSATTMGSSLMAATAAYAADKVYSGICDYWGEDFE